MISGRVTTDYEAVVPLRISGTARRQRTVHVVIDTGFDGWLSLPRRLIAHLGLPWRRRGRAMLADGSDSLFDIYDATVLWDGHRMRIPVDAAEAPPIIGMALLKGYELNVQVRARGRVTIKPLR